jgi:hypothetical protein
MALLLSVWCAEALRVVMFEVFLMAMSFQKKFGILEAYLRCWRLAGLLATFIPFVIECFDFDIMFLIKFFDIGQFSGVFEYLHIVTFKHTSFI